MSHIIDTIRADLLRTRSARTLIRRTLGLGFVAGFVNTVGFFDLHVYPGIMTGNTVQLGISLAHRDWHLFKLTALTIAFFFVGGIAGSLIRRHLKRRPLELIVMAALLLVATPVRARSAESIPFELGILAMAMAMQGETISRIGTVSIQTVVVTNTLVRFADAVAGRFFSAPASREEQGGHSRPTALEVAIPGSAWASYSIGACTGALATVAMRAPLLFPIFVLVVLVFDMLLAPETEPAADKPAVGSAPGPARPQVGRTSS